MTILVHLTSSDNVKAIMRSGIAASDYGIPGWPDLRGVFCMPLLPNFYASHQWLRELKRSGAKRIAAVDFRLKSEEQVLVGHFSTGHQMMSLGDAVGIIMKADDPRGYEIMVPRKILAKEIHRTRDVPQVVGWRYSPDAHGTAPSCDCPICLPKGSIKSKRLRLKLKRANDAK